MPGDIIKAFDGFEAVDILDYLFYDAKEFFTMSVISKDGEYDIEVEKYDDESLGLSFESDGLEMKLCHNNCKFCFVAQLPKGMRESLYVKDDDYRQSFLCGNYVTLTNVSDSDIERIIRLRLSPMYISVHSLVDGQREDLMGNRFAGKLYGYLEKLNAGGVEVHAQIVLLKGVNDGENLEKTCLKLAALENVKTLAVVPCGLTGHRENLSKIEDIDGSYSAKVIDQVAAINEKIGRTFVYCSDDFYIRARRDFEKYEHYGNFEQIENGVGMFPLFIEEYEQTAHKTAYSHTFLSVTGVAAKEFFEKYAKKTEELCEGLKIYVIAPVNKFFGPSITTAGLLTGQDVKEAVLSFDKDFDEVIIPRNMLKETEDVFLDGLSLEELIKSIKKPVKVVEGGGAHYFNALTGKE